MSLGYGGYAHLVAADDHLVVYSYCCYNVDLPDYKRFRQLEDGELFIDRDAFVEPERREKTVRSASGRKKTVIKRIKKDVPVDAFIACGRIRVKNAAGTWETTESGEDRMARRILFKIFDEYQEQGAIPEVINWYS